MKKYLLFLIIGTFLFSCSDDDSVKKNELIGKTFDHLWFETEQECLDAQPDPDFFINCHQEIRFVDEKKAFIMLTDIMYSVDYTVDDSKIIISENIVFEIINASSIKEVNDGTIWNERKGNSIWD
ncbi:hypothetical protein ACE193_09085 [Bernardetia sp. OM2101]|uniref:hypothetical protein n=1 Tax=Bernardetia sp. OM2101 TaxID=3344876 RepID=UPI0035D131D1